MIVVYRPIKVNRVICGELTDKHDFGIFASLTFYLDLDVQRDDKETGEKHVGLFLQ